MIELLTVLAATALLAFWAWAVLDVASRPADDLPDRGVWLALCLLGGPVLCVAYVSLRRPHLAALPPVDHGRPATLEVRSD